jgi:hypothetical protein
MCAQPWSVQASPQRGLQEANPLAIADFWKYAIKGSTVTRFLTRLD